MVFAEAIITPETKPNPDNMDMGYETDSKILLGSN